MVKLGLASSRERAKELINEGRVKVNGKIASKASFQAEETNDIAVEGETLKYVSRGGLKLEKAIADFNINLTGKTCMDIGASTGGFTDCMLQNGAVKVYAVDVGSDQLAERLRRDERVISMEHTNIRYITKENVENEAMDFISVDVSFISLTKVLPVVREMLKEGGEAVCLIKPQFEAGKQALSKKGVVTDGKIRDKVVKDIVLFSESTGFKVFGTILSPVKGGEGNIEYLIHLGKV